MTFACLKVSPNICFLCTPRSEKGLTGPVSRKLTHHARHDFGLNKTNDIKQTTMTTTRNNNNKKRKKKNSYIK